MPRRVWRSGRGSRPLRTAGRDPPTTRPRPPAAAPTRACPASTRDRIGDVAPRRILHRDPRGSGEQRIKALIQRPAASIRVHGAGQPVQVVTLDGVHQPPGLPLGRDEVVPAAGGHLGRVDEAGQRLRDGVGPVKVVEQPAIQAGRRETRLDGGDVEGHQKSIRRLGRAARMTPARRPRCDRTDGQSTTGDPDTSYTPELPALMPARIRMRRVPPGSGAVCPRYYYA